MLPVRLFKALCDPTRVAILAELASCCEPRTVGEVATCCPIDLSVVSRHLTQLREAGLVAAERQGKHVLYTARPRQLASTLRAIADAIDACCPGPDEPRRGATPTKKPKGATR